MSNGKGGAATSTAAPTANAWANPLRPKPNVAAGPPPGMGGKSKNNSGSNGAGGGSAGHQNALRERFISLSLTMVGQKVVVTQTNGAVFEGIFHTFSPFNSLSADIKNKFVIKACRVIKPPSDEGGSKTKQAVDQSTVIIGVDKVACLTVKSMRIDTATSGTNGSSQKRSTDGFRTDTEISGPKGGRSRDLVAAGSAWTTGGGGGPGGGSGNSRADALMGGLEDKDKGRGGRKGFGTANPASSGLQGNIGQWDQFRANEELFNVKSNFDESVYTTELNKSQIDKKKIAEAERLAREIENTTTGNMHMKEERNQKLADDYDDEARYSSVITSDKVAVPVSEKAEKKEKAKNDNSKSAPPKKMNYAAAAAKADPVKKSGPPGFSSGKEEEKESGTKTQSKEEEATKESEKEPVKDKTRQSEAAKPAEAKEPQEEAKKEEKAAKPEAPGPKQKAKPAEEKKAAAEPEKAKKAEAAAAPATAAAPAPATKEAAPPAAEEKAAPAEKAEAKAPSKLNANAKVFSLKATAKAFVPGGGHAPAPAPPAPEGQFVDPNAAAMHGAQVASHMPGPHYGMHGAQMVHQPGMMPMMNPPQFPGGVRYAAAGYGMDQSQQQQQQQHMAQQMQAQPQHAPPAHGSGAPSPNPASTDENAAQAPQQEGGEAAPAAPAAPMPQQPQQPGQPPQQQPQVPVPYGVPPAPYYGGQMMHPRGPGAPHPGYHPQFVGGPPQMVGQAGGPYRHMYPMNPGGMAPNVQVRGPAPYYAGPVPVPYPPNQYVNHNMMDDDPGFRGGQGRGRGRGGGRGRGRRGGRGGRNYNNYHQHGGRGHQGQNQNGPSGPSENWSSGPDTSNSQADGGGGMPGPSGANQSGKPGDKSAKQ